MNIGRLQEKMEKMEEAEILMNFTRDEVAASKDELS